MAPPEKEEAMQKVEKEASSAFSRGRKKALEQEHDKLAQSIRWLWYEFTPYEVGCDELGGKLSLGRCQFGFVNSSQRGYHLGLWVVRL